MNDFPPHAPYYFSLDYWRDFMIKQVLYTLFTLLILLTNNVIAGTLTVNISAIEDNNGSVFIGVFDNANEFPEGKPFQKIILKNKKNIAKHIFNLPKGKYAIATFQDKNSNKKLDKNFFGIPKEKYGFSGKQVFGKPLFQDSAINIQANSSIIINLK